MADGTSNVRAALGQTLQKEPLEFPWMDALDRKTFGTGVELLASDSHLDLSRTLYVHVVYGVECIDLVSLAPFPRPVRRMAQHPPTGCNWTDSTSNSSPCAAVC